MCSHRRQCCEIVWRTHHRGVGTSAGEQQTNVLGGRHEAKTRQPGPWKISGNRFSDIILPRHTRRMVDGFRKTDWWNSTSKLRVLEMPVHDVPRHLHPTPCSNSNQTAAATSIATAAAAAQQPRRRRRQRRQRQQQQQQLVTCQRPMSPTPRQWREHNHRIIRSAQCEAASLTVENESSAAMYTGPAVTASTPDLAKAVCDAVNPNLSTTPPGRTNCLSKNGSHLFHMGAWIHEPASAIFSVLLQSIPRGLPSCCSQ